MNEEYKKQIIEEANKIALIKAREIVSRVFSDVTDMTAKLRLLSIKNDIMDGVRMCLELIQKKKHIEILTDDCDLNQNTLIAYFGGNGDIYITISSIDQNEIRTERSVRIATSGGQCPTNIKVAAAELARAFETSDI